MEASKRAKTEKARLILSNMMVLLTVSLDLNGVLHQEPWP